ncbi:GNAT family N-acetyltransferase [Nocardioides sp. AX2bis]|uniref:GNAT family N-acetyltransferase n=1 Tax=Nocardioides sp. AX2bis TaxID=2653157 RepID=UPI0012F04553|nr:GNAT family N-acetyltransferase [Nocardioides sp. AX2bis]VXB57202.1 GNAT family N-acetyltransferase [Nocardioides sp. AX2bis]
MTELATPSSHLLPSWVRAVAEFGGSRIPGSGDFLVDGGRLEATEASGRALIDLVRPLADPATLLPEDLVRCEHWWLVDASTTEDPVVGFLALRHALTPFLLERGGHVGYAVRPSRRREGHARTGLRLALARAAGLGIERVLVTCDEDNVGSMLTIESAGGVLEDEREGKRRYWVTSHPA